MKTDSEASAMLSRNKQHQCVPPAAGFVRGNYTAWTSGTAIETTSNSLDRPRLFFAQEPLSVLRSPEHGNTTRE
jgi:hypothetical protein